MIYQNTYWRSGAVLAQDRSRALVKADREDKTIFIWVSGLVATRRQLLGTIRAHFDHIHRTISGINAVEKVPLPDHPEVLLNYQDLLKLEAMGETEWRVPELLTKVNVRQLLNGIELQKSRYQRSRRNRQDEDREDSTPKYDLRNSTIYGFATEGKGNAMMAGKTVAGNRAIGTQGNGAALTQEDALVLLSEMATLVEAAAIPPEVKAEARANLKTARKAAERQEPRKETMQDSLEEMAEALQGKSETMAAGKEL